MAKRLVVASLLLGVLGLQHACSDEPEIIYVYVTVDADGSEEADGTAGDALEDVDESLDAASEVGPSGDATGAPAEADAQTADDVGTDDVPPSEQPPLDGGLTDADGMVVHPASLEGLWYFGLGVEPATPLGSIGNTAIGILLLPSIVELEDGVMTIRVFDTEDFTVVEGDDGVIEQYAYTEWGSDGLVRIDFSEPLTSVEIELWQSCVYAMDTFLPYGDPVFADGLLTWTALEIYESQNCGNQGFPMSAGVNVHFLRREEANPDFTPRTVDPESPFGFFEATWSGTDYMTRMPLVGDGAADGGITYYVTDDFPADIRHVVDEVFEAWNDALEVTAGNRPFVVEDAPDGVVPWDPRYRVVYWDDSKSQGAIAPFLEDPFTGEMFDTDVIVWLGDMTDLIERYQEFFEKHPEVGDWIDASESEGIEMDMPVAATPEEIFDAAMLPPRVLRRRAYHRRPLHPAQIGQLFDRFGMSLDEQSIRELIIADFLVHEIGHNLGLRHNFEGSTDHVHFQTIDEVVATSTTTMDYVVGMTIPGSYDRDAMRHGYGDGAEETGYRFCTDEDVPIIGACAKWDFDNPVSFFLEVMDGLAEEYPPETDYGVVAGTANQEEWSLLLNRVRQLVNSELEAWDPESPVSTFDAMLSRVVCEAPCGQHLWFRNQYALYLLYTKHVVNDEWYTFPVLDEAQRETLFESYLALLLDPEQSAELKETIVNKLPTSSVEGADLFLDSLQAALEAIEEPTDQENWLLDLVDEVND